VFESAIEREQTISIERTVMHAAADPTPLTDRFDRALLYATHVHGGQVRKGTAVPYIAHLMAVAATVLEYGGAEDVAIAALLHDAVEDQGGEPRLADIRNRFGARVAEVVRACSDSVADTSAGEPKEDWRLRKVRYVAHLATADEATLLVSLADKVHNARSILRDLREPKVGAAVWGRFKASRQDTLWHYRELAKAFRQYRPGQLAEELSEIVDALEHE
jgi:(p)ppGpp synthase/HD superfamily hydrolase